MKKVKQITALLIMLNLISCNKEQFTSEETPTEPSIIEEKSSVLTHIFRESGFKLSEEYEIVAEAEPLYDSMTGEFTFLCSTESVMNDENGNEVDGNTYYRVVTDGNGILQSKEELGFFDRSYNLRCASFSSGSTLLCFSAFDMTIYQEAYSLAVVSEGVITEFDDPSVVLENPVIDDIALQEDGSIILLADGEVVVLNGEFVRQFSVFTEAESLSVYQEKIYCDGQRLNQDAQTLEEGTYNTGDHTSFTYFYGEDYPAYIQTDDGLYGCSTEKEPEMVLNFENSDLIAKNVDILKIINAETILLSDKGDIGLYKKTEDVDLSDVIVLDLAYTTSSTDLNIRVVEFNSSHSDIRIITKKYESSENLLTDMLNGIYSPDILTASAYDTKEITEIYSSGLFIDLYPLIDQSSVVDREDIFGCVKRTYETADGKLAAISGIFNVNTILGTQAALGNRTSWSVSEMVEYAAALPEGVSLMDKLSAENAADLLFGGTGYSAFVDVEAGICSFDSTDFISYLEFLKTLPKKFDYKSYDRAETAEKYGDGRLILAEQTYMGISDYLREESIFRTPEYLRIGYPSGGSFSGGSYITAVPFVITSFCEEPEAAWLFIETSLFDIGENNLSNRYQNGFPTLKSQFRQVCEDSMDYVYKYYYDGRYSMGINDPERPLSFLNDDRPGIVKYFTEEDAAELEKWLEGDVGIQLGNTVSGEISEIVEEEISSYLAGVRDAQSCAKMIQSRVNLWISEHE